MAQLKFYHVSNSNMSSLLNDNKISEGAIWFNTDDRTIQVYSGTSFRAYAGNLKDATFDEGTRELTLVKNDGSNVTLNFSDMASATMMSTIMQSVGLSVTDGTYTSQATNYGNQTTISGDIGKLDAQLKTVSDLVGTEKTTVEDVDTQNHVRVSITGLVDSVEVKTSNIASATTLSEVKAKVDAFFEGADISETAEQYKDTLKELQTYITTDTAAATAMTNSISNVKNALTNVTVNDKNLFGQLQGNVTAKTIVLSAEDINISEDSSTTVAASLETLDNKIDTLDVGVTSINNMKGSVNLSSGTANGTIGIQQAGGNISNINVYGLKSAAYTNASDYATAAQGTKADSAIQGISIPIASTSYLVVGNTVNNNVPIDAKIGTFSTNELAFTDGLASVARVETYVSNKISEALSWEEFE